ncbi:hypothetical protein YC2023_035828 [Brassica napus]
MVFVRGLLIYLGFGVAPLYGGRPTCFWEGVAFSAPFSPALGTGRRWLLQHRHRRLLLPGGGGFRSIVGTGVRLVEWLSSGFDLAVDGGR